jgi:hypothetical protein
VIGIYFHFKYVAYVYMPLKFVFAFPLVTAKLIGDYFDQEASVLILDFL